MGARIFNREELLGRSLDQLNLRWAWRRFWDQFRGGAEITGVVSWYRKSVFPALRLLRKPALVVSIALLGVFLGGLGIALVRPDLTLPADLLYMSRGEMVDNLRFVYTLGNGQMSVGAVVGQNLRVLAVGTLLGSFTFGVMAMFFASLPFGILGFLLAQPLLASLGVESFSWRSSRTACSKSQPSSSPPQRRSGWARLSPTRRRVWACGMPGCARRRIW